MADISKIKLGDTVYNINDANARASISSLTETVAGKADASNVYTKAEIIQDYATKEALNDKVSSSTFTDYQTNISTALDGKLSTADGLTKVEAATTYATKTDLSGKADASVVNTTFETISGQIDTKANANDVYDKTTSDSRYVQPSTLNDYTTNSSFNAYQQTVEGYLDNKADADDVYDKDAADEKFATITDLNGKVSTDTMNSAIAGVQGTISSEIAGVQGSLAALEGRLDIIDNSGETLETLAKIQAELQDPDNAEGLMSFLDTVKAAMNTGEVIDYDTQYDFTVGAQGTENEGILEITSRQNTNTTRVWVPGANDSGQGGNQGSQGSEPAPEPEP